MKQRHVLSIALLVLAVLVLLLFGLASNQWLAGVLLAAVFVLVGIFFYRRGK